MLKFSPILIILIPLLILSLTGNVFLLFNKTNETDTLLAKISELQKNRDRQKAEKDEIRRYWENQASLNDNLIASQDQVLNQIRTYLDEIDQSIRFVSTGPQLLPTISKDNLEGIRAGLLDKITNLEKTIDQNTKTKQEVTDKIDAIYKNGGEDQNNRANPRDGVRN